MQLLGAELKDIGTLGLYILAGFAIGWIAERILLGRMRAAARKRGWAGWQIVGDGIGHMPMWWFAVVAGWIGLVELMLDPRFEVLAEKTLVVLAGLTLTVAAARVAVGFVKTYAVGGEGPLPSTSIFVNLTRIFVVLLGILIILNALDISITPVLTALGVGGLAVALALQDTLGNLFAGIQIVASKQIRPGDFLQLDTGQMGYVEDITWRYTTLRMVSNNRVIIPNSKLAAAIVTNYQLPMEEMAVLQEVGVAYGSDLELVERICKEVAAEVVAEMEPGITDYEPGVRFHTLGESAIGLTVVLRASEFADQFPLKSAFIKRLTARFAAEGVEIPFPQRVVHQRD